MPSESLVYFPNFNLPGGDWPLRRLLYWDEIVIPAPHIVIRGPDHYLVGERTRALEAAGLVRFEPTEDHRRLIGGVCDELARSIGAAPDLEERQRRWRTGDRFGVHVGKSNDYLLPQLLDCGVADLDEDPNMWMVERTTGQQLVARIAAGIATELGLAAATDTRASMDDVAAEANASHRALLLDRALPAPARLTVKQLLKFREKHHDDLRSFRDVTELSIRAMARAITDDEAQAELANYNDMLDRAIAEVERFCRRSNLAKRVVAGKWAAAAVTVGGWLGAGIPLAVALGIAHGIGAGFIPQAPTPTSALIYGAWARRSL